ncbi:hypothetical protein KOR42_32780 [Thalassoglobus neptunius]|uniref:Carboxypeptidase regulatory-like domain-containing protein n=1 Tax=Thalassoglobus neptunius TaxID=1938619 RepID=A0A5C5WNM1_9PLAN|nr:hypothetical protein [Thalassoglobus neptunius]TWT51805.1 hypothetical protein KOR42_32780 [Thalassoglobus neptunius]
MFPQQLNFINKRSSVSLLAVTLTLVVGCGKADWQADTYPARGTLTINGENPVGALVELHPTGEATDVRNSLPWGLVEEDGTFTLSTYEMGDGAPPGQYSVTIKWSPDVNSPTLADRLNGAYRDPRKSQWTVTIAEEDNEIPLIEITDAKVSTSEQAGKRRKRVPGPDLAR